MNWKRNRLQLVKEEQARGRTGEIFNEIRHALGIPGVNVMFQALASFPQFFDLFWKTARTTLNTQEFFSFSERISAEAYTRVHNYFSVPALGTKTTEMNFTAGAQPDLREVVELYHYNYSVLLLLCTALIQAFENPGAEARSFTLVNAHPLYSKRPILVEQETAPATTRKIYADIRRSLGAPFLNTVYMGLARWPDFLSAYWESLKPLLKTPLYEHSRMAIRDSALSLAAALPQPLQLSTAHMEEAGVPKDDINNVVQLAESFLDLLSKQALNIAFAKIGLEDGEKSEAAA